MGGFLSSKAVLPQMIKQKGRSIMNISSLAADERDEGTGSTGLAYVSKAGLGRFTLCQDLYVLEVPKEDSNGSPRF